MTQGQLFLISAPSGAGKTSLVNAALEKDPRLVVSVSHTTRDQRGGEQDAVEYHFTDRNTFEQMIRAGGFLEHADVFGNYYGTAISEVEKKQADGKDVILEIDWQGAEQVRSQRPDATSIFILPPSIASLEERLTSRGQDSAESMQRRLSEARLDMSKAVDFDFLVINEDFETALEQLLAVFTSARLTTSYQRRRSEIRQLIDGTAR